MRAYSLIVNSAYAEAEWNFTEQQVGMLYSGIADRCFFCLIDSHDAPAVYSLPNIVSVYFGGMLMDRVGTTRYVA